MVHIVEEDCSIIQATKILGKKWVVFVLSELMVEPEIYFTDLQKHIMDQYKDTISARVLSECLSTLEQENIITRTVHTDSIPVRVSYALTEKGKDFRVIFGVLKGWGVKWGGVNQKVCKSYTCVHNAVSFIDIDKAKDLLPWVAKLDV